MRKLMWFTLGFTAACTIGVYWAFDIWLFLLMLFGIAVTVALSTVKSKAGKRTFTAMLGFTIGVFWLWGFDAVWLSQARDYDGMDVEGVVEVSDYSWETANGVAATGRITLEERVYRVQLYCYQKDALEPGDKVIGQFRLRYTADGGEKAPTYHQGKGIFLLAYADDCIEISRAEKVPGRYFALTLRRNILEMLDNLFPKDTVGFARALLLGDDSKLSYDVDNAFQKSGISHVIAVSGMHVSILFSLIYTICGKRRVLTAVLGIPLLLLFAAVAGFAPSIIRACIMQSLVILALLLNKEYDQPTALSFSVLTMLAVNPLTITSVGFQLSVGCMVGIFLLSGRIFNYLLDEKRLGPAKGKSLKSRLIRWFAGAVSMTLGATVATTPLCAYYFSSVSVVGILTNLLTLWVITFIFYGIMLACLLSLFWFPLGAAVAAVISWPVRYILVVAKALAKFPVGAVFMNNAYIIAWLVFTYVLISVFLAGKKKHPVVLGVCIALGLCVSLALSWIEPRLDDYRVTVLDVGQGQCILLQNEDRYYMVDCGGDYGDSAADIAAGQLLSQGITRLDGLVLTHYDADHAGGAEALLSRISANKLYLPDTDKDNKFRKSLETLYDDRIIWVDSGETLATEGFPVTLFAADGEKSGNESSMCILFQPGNCDILITGDRDSDGEQALMEMVQLPELELLVVGHHGSKSSTSIELLRATTPAMAVISVGEGNAYGHPTQVVLDRLEMIGCRVWRTDLNGTLIFRG